MPHCPIMVKSFNNTYMSANLCRRNECEDMNCSSRPNNLHNGFEQQARAMGQSFTETRFTAIYASTLKRAFTTAQALYDGQKDPKPTFTSSPLLREQHFGIAEGKPWTYHREKGMTLEEQFDQRKFPVLHYDDEKFPGGESLNDLAARANRAIEELVLPHVWTAAKEGEKGVHIALVSHGLCISQLMAQLLKHNADGPDGGDYRGLKNTAWSRVTISMKVTLITIEFVGSYGHA